MAVPRVRLFSDPNLPSRLFFDTSFLVDLIVASQPRHAAAEGFFARLVAEKDGRRFFLSALTYAEFAQATARIFLIADHGMEPREAQVKLQTGGLHLVIGPVLAALANLDDALDLMYEEIQQVRLDVDLWKAAAKNMSQNWMLPYDSLHVAAARSAKALDIVTFDRYFDRAPDLTLWRDRL